MHAERDILLWKIYVRLSVCTSHSGIVSKRMYISSNSFHHMIGALLWLLSNKSIDEFPVAWRRAVRRVLCLPSGTHCNLLPLLNESLPVSLDVCNRSARFILSCLKSKSKFVRSVASFNVLFGRHESIIGSNAIFCC